MNKNNLSRDVLSKKTSFNHFLLIMRTAIILLFTCVFISVAETGHSQNAKVTLNKNNASLKEVLNEIESQTDYLFIYNNKVSTDKKVSVKTKNGTVRKVLTHVLKDSDVDFMMEGNHIILSYIEEKIKEEEQAKVVEVVQQGKTISGKVTDSRGEPIPGATIMIKGTGKGTISDIDGNFTFAGVSEDGVLQVSFIGMESVDLNVDGKSTFNIVLNEETFGLDEVVVVGYGVQKRGNVTGSVASVTSENLTKVPAPNTSALLAGRLPGMVVTNNSGQPGRDEANISIRGFGNALIIVDGVPRDFQQLDPNEIESISILKDASAAVYGARAGNGVVLVTTKKGSRDSTPKINYTGNMSLQRPTYIREDVTAAEYASYFQQAEKLANVAPENYTYSNEDIEKYRAGVEPGYMSTSWQDIVLRDWAPMQQHNVNVSGGTDKVNYFVSLGNLNQKSLLKSGAGSYNRNNISSNLDVNVTDNLKVGLNLKYRMEDRDDPVSREIDPNEYALIFLYLNSSKPTASPIPNEPDMMAYVAEAYQNPLAYSRQDLAGFSKDQRKQFDMIFSMNYKLPLQGLSLDGKLYLKNYNRLNRSTRKPYTVYKHDYNTGENIPMASLVENFVNVHDWKYNQVTPQVSINYDRQFGDHNVSAMALTEYQYIDRYELGAGRTDLISTEIPYLYSGNGAQTNFDIPDEDGKKSFVSRINYNYKEKYLLELLFRADASIQFPKDKRWGYFPGISAGWRISEESFLKDTPSLDYLKLRASYASLGYDAISSFDYLTGYELRSEMEYKYGFGNHMNQSTLQSIGLANPFITWESMSLYNFGIDGTFWRGLLGFEVDAFYRLRTGLLQDRMATVPSTFGGKLPKENIGERDNRGFEFVLNHQNKIKDFRYNISANVTWTREKYVYEEEREFDLDDPDDARLNKRTGEWVNRTFGYKTNGFYNSQEEIDNDKLEHPELGEPILGDIRYVDINGDGVIDYRDQLVIGKGNIPELFFGLNFDMQYKGFDFSMLWQGASNYNIMIPRNFEAAPNLSIGQVPNKYHVKYAWNPENPSAAKLPAPSLGGPNTHNKPNSDVYMRDGKYLRLKTINLGYTIPRAITDKIKIKRLRVFAAAYNLFTLQPKDVFRFDPEARGGDSGSTYPVQKVITLGLNVEL